MIYVKEDASASIPCWNCICFRNGLVGGGEEVIGGRKEKKKLRVHLKAFLFTIPVPEEKFIFSPVLCLERQSEWKLNSKVLW